MAAAHLDDLPVPDAVVFDLDGTLVDTVATRIEAWLEALAEAGLSTTRDQLAPLIGLDGKRLAREIAALAGEPIDEVRSEAIDRRSGEIYELLNRSPRALPGVRRLVEAIEENDIPWAIATSSRKEQVATSVASHVKHAKPEPDLLLLAAKEVGVEPARCWYIGDSTWDMVSAVAAGMIAIGVYAGSAVEPGVLEGAGAAAVVPTLNELADAFGHDA
jgi:beta-phosphoglucomutase-like phosphatase (HAD superfamily)